MKEGVGLPSNTTQVNLPPSKQASNIKFPFLQLSFELPPGCGDILDTLPTNGSLEQDTGDWLATTAGDSACSVSSAAISVGNDHQRNKLAAIPQNSFSL